MKKGYQSQILLVVVTAIGLVLMVFPQGAQSQPVHFKELMAFLPTVPPKGWQVEEGPKGTTIKSPVPMSEAEIIFHSGENKRLEVKIVDGFGGVLPFLGLAHSMEMESSEEYQKPVTIQGFKGMETYKFKDKEGELQLAVANRFLITLTGHGLENNDLLKEIVGKMDLNKLAGLAK